MSSTSSPTLQRMVVETQKQRTSTWVVGVEMRTLCAKEIWDRESIWNHKCTIPQKLQNFISGLDLDRDGRRWSHICGVSSENGKKCQGCTLSVITRVVMVVSKARRSTSWRRKAWSLCFCFHQSRHLVDFASPDSTNWSNTKTLGCWWC